MDLPLVRLRPCPPRLAPSFLAVWDMALLAWLTDKLFQQLLPPSPVF